MLNQYCISETSPGHKNSIFCIIDLAHYYFFLDFASLFLKEIGYNFPLLILFLSSPAITVILAL